MGARLPWEQEPRCRKDGRFDPEGPDSNATTVVEGWSPAVFTEIQSSDKRVVLRSIRRATTELKGPLACPLA